MNKVNESAKKRQNCSEDELSDRRSSSSSESRQQRGSSPKKPRIKRDSKKKSKNIYGIRSGRLSASDSDWNENMESEESSSDSDPIWSPVKQVQYHFT